MHLILIAAVARNRVIGKNNALVWRRDEDLRRFRELTTGHAVLMGRKTWESVPERYRPLPGRFNLILTRTPFDTGSNDALCVTSLVQAIEEAEGRGFTKLFVIGGGEVYRIAIEFADCLELTEIDTDLDGDTTFPERHETWRECVRIHRQGFDFVTYTR